jgi:hypothetical protein
VRLQRLVQAAFADLRATALDDTTLHGRRVRYYVGLPDLARIETGNERMPEADRPPPEQAEPEPPDAVLRRAETILRRALASSLPPGSPHDARHIVVSGVATGASALFHLLTRATQDLRAQAAELAVIVTVDSLLDDHTLTWLDNTRRLKTPHRATGLMPGEAAVALLVEAPHHAQARAVPAQAAFTAVAFAHEPNPIMSGKPPRGEALASGILATAPFCRWTAKEQVWFISDHDGEEYRAMEWGNAYTHLLRESQIFASANAWYPAASYGHTGVAGPAIALCTAARAFARGYAPHQAALITCSSDSGERAVGIVSAPGG